jgi:hypothetical protein
MTETMGAVTSAAVTNDDVAMLSSPTPEELATGRELVRAARARGVSFADTADGVLKALTKTVVETALEEELSDHLGYDKHDPAGRNGGDSRNGTRTKNGVERHRGRDRDRGAPIVPAASIHRSCGSINAAWLGSMKSCRCMPRD